MAHDYSSMLSPDSSMRHLPSGCGPSIQKQILIGMCTLGGFRGLVERGQCESRKLNRLAAGQEIFSAATGKPAIVEYLPSLGYTLQMLLKGVILGSRRLHRHMCW